MTGSLLVNFSGYSELIFQFTISLFIYVYAIVIPLSVSNDKKNSSPLSRNQTPTLTFFLSSEQRKLFGRNGIVIGETNQIWSLLLYVISLSKLSPAVNQKEKITSAEINQVIRSREHRTRRRNGMSRESGGRKKSNNRNHFLYPIG